MTSHRALLLLLSMAMIVLAVGACGSMLWHKARRDEILAARMRSIRAGRAQMPPEQDLWMTWIAEVAARFGALLMRAHLVPRKTLHEAEMLLTGANLRGETIVAAFLGGKTVLMLVLPLAAWMAAGFAHLTDNLPLLAAVFGAAVGVIGPDMALGHRRRLRLAAIQRGLPDALDLLVICADAGLAFDTALERVTREIAPVHPEVAEEFAVTAAALRIAPDRRAVLMELGSRLDLDFLRRLSATLAQSLQLGAPLSRSLRSLAQELRQEQMLRFEEKAARLPVLLTVPMVLFIMPTVLLVIGGPAAVQMVRAFQ